MFAAIQHGAKAVLVVKRHSHAGQHGLSVGEPGLLVFRQVNRDTMSKLNQRFGQSAYNISQAARLGKGHAFRSGKENIKAPRAATDSKVVRPAPYKNLVLVSVSAMPSQRIW